MAASLSVPSHFSPEFMQRLMIRGVIEKFEKAIRAKAFANRGFSHSNQAKSMKHKTITWQVVTQLANRSVPRDTNVADACHIPAAFTVLESQHHFHIKNQLFDAGFLHLTAITVNFGERQNARLSKVGVVVAIILMLATLAQSAHTCATPSLLSGKASHLGAHS
jgi:hypothetical protein